MMIVMSSGKNDIPYQEMTSQIMTALYFLMSSFINLLYHLTFQCMDVNPFIYLSELDHVKKQLYCIFVKFYI